MGAVAFLAVGAPAGLRAQSPPAPPPLAAPPPTNAPAAQPTRTTRQVARGVTLTQEITPDGDPNGPLVVTVLRVNGREKGVRIEAALGGDEVWAGDPTEGREIVSSLAARRGAVAGVNASFFPFAGNPIGLHIERGELVTEPTLKRSGFAVDAQGKARVTSWSYMGGVSRASGDGAGIAYPLGGFNRKPGKGDELLLYTPRFWNKTLPAPGRFEVALAGVGLPLTPGRSYSGTIAAPAGENGGFVIKPDTVVLSGGGTGAAWLREAVKTPHAKLTFDIVVTDNATGALVSTGDINNAIAGGPRLVRNGLVSVEAKEEGMGTAFSTTRHPRTAIGVTKNGEVLLLVVDGRQAGLSRGASLAETAALLIKFGAVDGVNMDGGGSSAMTIHGGVANSPSEGAERPVADAFLVFADDATEGVPTVQAVVVSDRPLLVGETRRVALPRGWDAGKTVWTTEGGRGFVAQDGTFHALRAGAGFVRASAGSGGDKTFRVPVTVVAPFKIAPPVLLDAAGFAARVTLVPNAVTATKATLLIQIANAEGDPLAGEAVEVFVSGGKGNAATVTTNAKGEARVEITWDATPATERIIRVTSPVQRFNPAGIPPLPAPPPARPW